MKSKSKNTSVMWPILACGIVSVLIEIIGIILISRGSYLESLYCKDIYAWWITTGALLFACGSFVQKKLPWAYTRFGELFGQIKHKKNK